MKPEEELAISKMTDQEMIAAQEIYNKVLGYFYGNSDKANTWFEYPNALLGGMPPKLFLINGRMDKLKSFIDSQFKDNRH